MKYPVSFWLKIALGACIFTGLKLVISYVALSSFTVMKIDAEFDHDDVIDVYYSSGIHGDGFRAEYSKRSQRYARGIRAVKPVFLSDHVARKIRIDTGTEPGAMKLFAITLVSYYGPDITFDYRQIYNNFKPNDNIDAFSLEQDHVLVKTASTDPFIVFSGEMMVDNYFLSTILPLMIALLAVVFVSHQPMLTFPAFADINAKRSSSGANVGALDGIRGMAALLVLGQHTGVMKGGGVFGVWLFFCLSGFLLATPFIQQPGRALSYSYMCHYITRRIKRIVPMYYTVITVTLLFLGKFEVAIRHYLFLEADGHYWTVAQEMFFYLLLPLVMAASAVFFRNKRGLAIIFLGLTAYLSNRFITIDVVPLYGDNVTLRPFVGVFLIGVLMSYIYNWARDRFSCRVEGAGFRRFFSISGLVLLLICLLISAHIIPGTETVDISTRPGWFGLGAGLFILFTLFARGTSLDRLMNLLPLRAVGLVGFSFYLLHPMMISCVRGITMYFANYYPVGILLFVLAGLASYTISAFTYSYIERPFIKSPDPKTLQSHPETLRTVT